MKLKKYSSGSLIKSKNPNSKNNSSKNSNNIILNKLKYAKSIKFPYQKSSKICLYKNKNISKNLNSKEHKKTFSINFNNNSQKSLITKSNSEIRFKTDFGINTSSTNFSSNVFSIQKNSRIITTNTNNFLSNKKKQNVMSKNFSSRNFNRKVKSFELLKMSNEDLIPNGKKIKGKKIVYSINTNKKLKNHNLIKNKSNANLMSKLKDNLYVKANENINHIFDKNKNSNSNNKCELLSTKNKKRNNLSLLFDKYICNSTNCKIFQNEKENLNSNMNSNNNSNNNNTNINKYNKSMLYVNNITTNKINNNIYNKITNFESHIKQARAKNSFKNKNNLPFHPNSKMIKLINQTELNQCHIKKNSTNSSETNIPFDKKKISKIKSKNSPKFFKPINLRKKNSQKIINNKPLYEFNCFSDKSHSKNKSKIDIKYDRFTDINFNKNNIDEKEVYEGVEMGHFKIVRLIQDNKIKIRENDY